METITDQMQAPEFIGKLNANFQEAAQAGSGSGSGSTPSTGAQRTVKVQMQGGKIVNGYLVGSTSTGSDFFNYMSSVLMMNIEGCSLVGVTTETGETLTIFCYAADMGYLGSTSSVSSLSSGTCYVKFMLQKSSAYSQGRVLSVAVKGNPMFVKNNVPSLLSAKFFVFETAETYQTEPNGTLDGNNGSNAANTKMYLGSDNSETNVTSPHVPGTNYRVFDNGWVMLPPNYSPNGEPVPLAVYCHGTSGYLSMGKNALDTAHSFPEQMEFLCKNGYAVADCSGLTSDNPYGTTCALGMPGYRTSISNMVKFLISNYNVRTDGVYVWGKSSGGFMCHSLGYQQPFKIKAVGAMNPAICLLLSQPNHVLQKLPCVRTTADQIGAPVSFEITNASGMEWSNTIKQYYLDNISRWRKIDPFFEGTDLDDSQVGSIISDCFGDAGTSGFPKRKIENVASAKAVVNAAKRWVNCPTMIWSDPADTSVEHDTILKYTQMAQRTGSPVYLRTMPQASGRHFSTDTAEEAIKTTYKTKYGGSVEIAVAYAELVDWFNRW